MPSKNVVCVVVDRLHAGMLGAYGNAWMRTPAFDRLAAEGFVFDQAFADCPHLASLYRSYWHGLPPLARGCATSVGLPQQLSSRGCATALITDEPELAAFVSLRDFQERIEVAHDETAAAAEDESQTQMGRLFGTAFDWLEQAREPFFLWIHSRGMAGAWDAPFELRDAYVEEEDPEASPTIDVPRFELSEDHDPDEILGLTYAYAGQVSLLDMCAGALVDQLRESRLEANTLFIVVGARGFPLGEHGRFGPHDAALHNETVQTPWMLRFPQVEAHLGRSQALVLPSDLPATVFDWLGVDTDAWPAQGRSLLPIVRGQRQAHRDRIYLTSSATLALPLGEGRGEGAPLSTSDAAPLSAPAERALRTPAWLLKLSSDASGERLQLYAKPSDRWEVSEVADRCPEIAAELKEVLLRADETEPNEPSPLAEPLVTEVD